ncbi:ferric reductase-like transmembrane domain-containing protein [Marinobacter changyiensis]|uniref:ferric reductase-like transmembrane domain-containing protein n=1 Tax=Marinobacter changyiensis TaxID=2604091 RepID=UPI00126568F8|nr:ferric reductase-like transmembrane domain-containing protein [Marinobacter changyiensis]
MVQRMLRSNLFWEVLALVIISASVATWVNSVSPLDSWRWSEPPGQGFYLLSKLFGLLAVAAIWWQVLAAILNHPTISSERLRGHRYMGVVLMLTALLHYMFFVSAVYLRNQTFPFELLYPVFDNYFKLSLSAGWFAFICLVVTFAAAVFRRKLGTAWRLAHRLAYLAVIFGVLHGFLIGTETGYGLFSYIYYLLIATIVVALVTRIVSAGRKPLFATG